MDQVIRLPARTISPLRYAGGKQKFSELLVRICPDDVVEYREPFGGGGSMLLRLRRMGLPCRYWYNDINSHLTGFFLALRDKPGELIRILEVFHARWGWGDADGFALWKATLGDASASPLEKAAAYYAVNRTCFGGLTSVMNFSPNHGGGLRLRRISQLREWSKLLRGVQITNKSYDEVFAAPGRAFIFADSPYTPKCKKENGKIKDMALYPESDGFDFAAFGRHLAEARRP